MGVRRAVPPSRCRLNGRSLTAGKGFRSLDRFRTERWNRHGKVALAAAPFVVHGGASMCTYSDESSTLMTAQKKEHKKGIFHFYGKFKTGF
jgi:hypothetical protein